MILNHEYFRLKGVNEGFSDLKHGALTDRYNKFYSQTFSKIKPTVNDTKTTHNFSTDVVDFSDIVDPLKYSDDIKDNFMYDKLCYCSIVSMFINYVMLPINDVKYVNLFEKALDSINITMSSMKSIENSNIINLQYIFKQSVIDEILIDDNIKIHPYIVPYLRNFYFIGLCDAITDACYTNGCYKDFLLDNSMSDETKLRKFSELSFKEEYFELKTIARTAIYDTVVYTATKNLINILKEFNSFYRISDISVNDIGLSTLEIINYDNDLIFNFHFETTLENQFYWKDSSFPQNSGYSVKDLGFENLGGE